MTNVTFAVSHIRHYPSHDSQFYEVCDLPAAKLVRSLAGIYKGNAKYLVITGILSFIAQIELLTQQFWHHFEKYILLLLCIADVPQCNICHNIIYPTSRRKKMCPISSLLSLQGQTLLKNASTSCCKSRHNASSH